MANKRMFSLDVVDTDRFTDMPASTQALYFHLGMRADDDGVVSSPRGITRRVNCGDDDLRILASKGFIIPFESGVIVVTHWNLLNNKIKSDRYKPTQYREELSRLTQRDGAYYLNGTRTEPTWNQNGTSLEPQNRIDKNNISISFNPDGLNGSDSKEKTVSEPVIEPQEKSFDEQTSEDFEKIYAIYPRKQGKAKALKYYRQWVKGRKIGGKTIHLTPRQIYLAVDKYADEQAGKEQQFVKMASTFFNTDILDYIPPEEDAD